MTGSAAARSAGFEDATEPLRRELTAHCYRMLGSWDEAEDAVQEAYLRAWRGWAEFQHRASVRTWLHRIATNVALSALDGRARRALPSGLGAPEAAGRPEYLPAETWIQPYADDRDDLRLALVAGLQTLTPGQRAVLLLRDVLAFPTADVAEMLNLTSAAVKSTLQRARARLAHCPVRPDDVVEPRSPTARRQLAAYVTAFRTADIAGLTAVLRRDDVLTVMLLGRRSEPEARWQCYLAGCASFCRVEQERRAQWLRGVLDLCVLALLAEGESYGYELAQALERAGLGSIQGGSLYPVLLRLERSSLVSTEWRAGGSGPARKYYLLTPAGREKLARSTDDWSAFADAVGGILRKG